MGEDVMKKSYAVLLLSITLFGCAELESLKRQIIPASFNTQDLLGEKWFCKSSYGQWTGNTEEYYQYHPNGTVTNDGIWWMNKDGHRFEYKYKVKANWNLQGWKIREHLQTYQIRRNFSAKTQRALRSNKALREWEKSIYQNLINMAENAKKMPAIREIESLSPNALTTKYLTSYVICAR